MSANQSNRTTIRLPDDLHRRLKVLAASRGRTMQDILETALTMLVESGADEPGKQRARRKAAVPAHLYQVVECFVEFWQRPRSPTDEQVRNLMETILASYR